jgi:PAS domain S-box-containing protein
MEAKQAKAETEPPRRPPLSSSPLARYGLAWLPVPLALAAMAGLWVADVRAVWHSPVLSWLLSDGGALLGLLFIALPAARSFLAGGQASVLMLGCGVLMSYIGAACMPSGLARGTDTGFAVYNTSILLSALCQFAGVAAAFRRKTRLSHTAAWLTAAYAGGASAMAVVVWLAFTGRMPAFFVEGQGGTPLRNAVVSLAAALFAATAGLLWRADRRAPSAFLRWYALGLVLLATGLAEGMTISVTDSPLHWAARLTQTLGLVYTCIAVLASSRETGVREISLAEVLGAWGKSGPVTAQVWRYGLAVSAVAAAFALNRLANGWAGPGLPPYITFYPAVMLAALLGGLGPGLAATALSACGAVYWILPPVEEFAVASPIDRLALVIFSIMGVAISAVCELYQRSRQKAEAYDREQALRETRREKELLASLLELASQPFAVGYPDGRLGRLNRAFERLTGYSAAELHALDWTRALTPPEWREMESRKLEELHRTGEPVRYQKEYIRKDGSRVPIELLVHVVRDAGGQPEYYYSFLTDITERKRAGEAQRRLAQFPEENPSPVLRVARDGALLYCNTPARDFLAAMGEAERGALPAPLQALAADAFQSAHGVEEVELGDPRGRTFWFGAAQPPGENYVNLYGRDITSRTRAEEELRRNREWLQVTLTSIGDGVIACDTEGRVTFVNPVAASLSGWTESDALGQPVERVFDIVNEVTHQPGDGLVARVLSERRPLALANGTALVARDGRRTPIEDSAAPILDGAGNLTGVVLVFHDVTQKRRAQEALRESEERYRSLFRNMEEGFALHEVVTDAAGAVCDYRFLDVNPGFERLTGLKAAELVGRTVREALPGIEPEWIERYGRVALTGEPATFESYAAPLGRWYQASAYRPSPGRFAVVFMDITARREAEERLREAQKLEGIGLLAGGIAHDFNNLLVGVIGSASLAQDMTPPGSPVTELLEGILKTGDQLAHLTRQMLAYAGQGRFYLERLNLSDLIPEMRALVQPSIPHKIELSLELERGLPAIEADRGQMQQVFMNLVLNAAEAIGVDAGWITVKTGVRLVEGRNAADLAPGEYVYLEVRDTGCGMDDATRSRIFDPFFSTKFVGRGLGLAAVGGIVRGHKGAITVASSPGNGACFTVLLPATENAVAAAQAAARNADLSGNGTILVVDDEKIVRETARITLERLGYRVLVAERGSAAIDVFKRHPGDIALVFLDLSMPGMGGEEVLPELRKIRPRARVVVSSGYSETETMRIFAGQDVSGFLQKPFTSRDIAEKVKAALG